MTVELKPIEDQTIVIAGASSGIGLTTARMAAERGARLVVAARSEDALDELVAEIRSDGGEAVSVAADVSDPEAVREIAAVAEETYGGFDTWVNVAANFIYGRLRDVPVEEMREQFDTNVWGLLQGSIEAADHLERRGGAIINIGSVASEQAIIYQGSYSASKHAVKALTDTLRMELDDAGAPISVTLIEPAAIDTPYPEHAKNYMDKAATLPPPVYAPETVARAILHAAETPEREIVIGGGGKFMTTMGRYAPGLMDAITETVFAGQQREDRPPRSDAPPIIEEPSGELRERGGYDGHVAERSLYTRARLNKSLGRGALVGLGLVAAAAYAYRKASGGRDDEGEVIRITEDEEREQLQL